MKSVAFIHRYLELPADFEEIASLYVLLTWVYEFAPSIPYLRVIGDWGTGKTRFLQVAGAVCFRPIFASGATTPVAHLPDTGAVPGDAGAG